MKKIIASIFLFVLFYSSISAGSVFGKENKDIKAEPKKEKSKALETLQSIKEEKIKLKEDVKAPAPPEASTIIMPTVEPPKYTPPAFKPYAPPSPPPSGALSQPPTAPKIYTPPVTSPKYTPPVTIPTYKPPTPPPSAPPTVPRVYTPPTPPPSPPKAPEEKKR